MAYRTGRHHIIKIGNNVLCSIGDLKVHDAPNVAIMKSRCGAFDKVKPVSKTQTISGTVYYDNENLAFLALKYASIHGTPIAIIVEAHPDFGVSADETLSGTYHVTNWERDEPVEDYVTVNFELQPAANYTDPFYQYT